MKQIKNNYTKLIAMALVLLSTISFSSCDKNDDDVIEQTSSTPTALYLTGDNKEMNYTITQNYPGNNDTAFSRKFQTVANGVYRELHTFMPGSILEPNYSLVAQYLKPVGKFIAVHTSGLNIDDYYKANNFMYHDSVKYGSIWSYKLGNAKYICACIDTPKKWIWSIYNPLDSLWAEKLISIKNVDSPFVDQFFYNEKHGIIKYDGTYLKYTYKSRNY